MQSRYEENRATVSLYRQTIFEIIRIANIVRMLHALFIVRLKRQLHQYQQISIHMQRRHYP